MENPNVIHSIWGWVTTHVVENPKTSGGSPAEPKATSEACAPLSGSIYPCFEWIKSHIFWWMKLNILKGWINILSGWINISIDLTMGKDKIITHCRDFAGYFWKRNEQNWSQLLWTVGLIIISCARKSGVLIYTYLQWRLEKKVHKYALHMLTYDHHTWKLPWNPSDKINFPFLQGILSMGYCTLW